MPTYLLLVPGAIALLLAVFFFAAALFGNRIAGAIQAQRYRRKRIKSNVRAYQLRAEAGTAKVRLAEAGAAQRHRSSAKRQQLNQWQSDFLGLLSATYFSGQLDNTYNPQRGADYNPQHDTYFNGAR